MLKIATFIFAAGLSIGGHEAVAASAPVGLYCSFAVTQHANLFPKKEVRPEDANYNNLCVDAVQAYVRSHCPTNKHTIWQQIEAVAFSGPGIPNNKALQAACR